MPQNPVPVFSNAASDSRRIADSIRELIRLMAQKVVKQITQPRPSDPAKPVDGRN